MKEFSWALAPNHKDRTADWFWAIGLMTVVGAITAIVVGNTLFGIFIIIAGTLLFYVNLHKGSDIVVHINEKTITVNELGYPLKKLKGFSITKNGADEDILIVKTDRFFLPMIILQIPDSIPLGELSEMLEKKVLKEDLHEPPANALAEKLGF